MDNELERKILEEDYRQKRDIALSTAIYYSEDSERMKYDLNEYKEASNRLTNYVVNKYEQRKKKL